MNELGVLLPVDLVSPTRLRGLENPRLSLLSIEPLGVNQTENNSSLETGSTFDRTIGMWDSSPSSPVPRLLPSKPGLPHLRRWTPRGPHSLLLNQGLRNPGPHPAHLCTHSSLRVLLPVRTRRGPSSPRPSALVGLGEAPSHVRRGGFSEVRQLSPAVCGHREAPCPLCAERRETLSVWSALGPSMQPPGDNLEQPFPS